MDMEWPLILFLIFGSLLFLFSLGIPIAFAFLLIYIIGVYLLWGGESGLHQLVLNMFDCRLSFYTHSHPHVYLDGRNHVSNRDRPAGV